MLEKAWECLGKLESLGKLRNVCYSLGKLEKGWERYNSQVGLENYMGLLVNA